MAKAFRVPWQDLTYATDRPQLVLETAGAAAPTVASAGSAGPVVMPRFDTYFANLVRDEAALLDDARKCCVVVPHIQTRLTAETEVYVAEMRSEERRVGKGCVSKCGFRGSPYH